MKQAKYIVSYERKIIYSKKLLRLVESILSDEFYPLRINENSSEIELNALIQLIHTNIILSRFQIAHYQVMTLQKVWENERTKRSPKLYTILRQHVIYFSLLLKVQNLKALIHHPSNYSKSRKESIKKWKNPNLGVDSILQYEFDKSFKANIEFNLDVKKEEYHDTISQLILEGIYKIELIDPEIFELFLNIVKEYYQMLGVNLSYSKCLYSYDFTGLNLIKAHLNPDLNWNVMICYDYKFTLKYFRSSTYISNIKNQLKNDDSLSFYTYEGNSLRRNINCKVWTRVVNLF